MEYLECTNIACVNVFNRHSLAFYLHLGGF